MLIRLPSFKRLGVKRQGWERWRAVDADPQFWFIPAPGASFVLFEIENADRTLDPRIFVDHGRGFAPEEEIELRQTRDGVYAVALKSFGRVRRLRIDPASYPAEFGFRAFAAYDEKSARAYIGKRLRAAATGDRAAPTCEVIARGGADELAGLGSRAARIRGVTQHYEQVIALAGYRYAGAAPWAGDRPLVSFVTPVYDTKPAYLDQLLESFRMQRENAFQLILADDGSSSPQT
ncbi:MAG TPA: glycosyltransferase, partial [Methylosinus sp.]